MIIVILGALFFQFVVPIGLIFIGAAFAELRSTSKNAQLISSRVIFLTGSVAVVSVANIIALTSFPPLFIDWEAPGPNAPIVLGLWLLEVILGLWLASATGYIGYSLWLKARYGDERPEVDGN